MNMKKTELKSFFKYFLGAARCIKFKIINHGKVYVGKGVHVIGGKNIEIHKYVTVRPYVELWSHGKICINLGAEIGTRSRISIAHQLIIGEKVLISPDVYITDCDHAYENINISVMEQGIETDKNVVEIGDHSFIGIHTVIVGNVRIGKHCVIGANSVVTKDVPDYSVAAGVPAKVVKTYNFEKKCWEKIHKGV